VALAWLRAELTVRGYARKKDPKLSLGQRLAGSRGEPALRFTCQPSVLNAADYPTLITALLAQDPRAPRILWQRFAPTVFRILRRMLGASPEVEDLAQEVFLRVFRKAAELRERRALPAFIISTARLIAYEEIRRSRRHRMPLPELVQTPLAELQLCAAVDAREALARFRTILGRLTSADRSAFVLRYVQEVPLTDVADRLGVSVATTKRRLARVWSRVALFVERDTLLSHYRARDRGRRSGEGTGDHLRSRFRRLATEDHRGNPQAAVGPVQRESVSGGLHRALRASARPAGLAVSQRQQPTQVVIDGSTEFGDPVVTTIEFPIRCATAPLRGDGSGGRPSQHPLFDRRREHPGSA
jgi:RNA polymerase sigma-70 factor, ECF subfamily